VFKRLEPSIKSKLQRCDKEKQLTNATGGTMTLLGELKITIDLEGREGVTSFNDVSVVVVNNLQSDMLFGADILTKEKYKSYKVDLSLQHIVFENQNGKQESVVFNQEPVEGLNEKPISVFMLKKTRVPAHSSLVTTEAVVLMAGHKLDVIKRMQSKDEEKQQEFEVEEIIDRRQEKGQLYYLVKWKNFDSSANSWEPISNLIHCREMIKEYEKKKKKVESVEPLNVNQCL